MNVMDIIALHPQAGEIMAAYGLHCFHCSFNAVDSLEAGARSHGLEDQDIENMVDDVNKALKNAPARPAMLALTAPAAKALLEIMDKEKKTGSALTVIAEEAGGFCMEFSEKPATDDKSFWNPDVPDMKIYANPLTLSHIGGSTIDFREGRFKLDLPTTKTACGCGGKCECGKLTG